MAERNRLIIHCADTPNGRVTTARDIDRWHAARFDMAPREEEAIRRFAPWYAYVGYHAVIYIDGSVERTRAETEKGSHCSGYNHDSIGVCLIGTDAFTLAQWAALKDYTEDVLRRWGPLSVAGHRVYNPNKTCPGFEVQAWRDGGMAPLEGHIFTLPSNPLPLP